MYLVSEMLRNKRWWNCACLRNSVRAGEQQPVHPAQATEIQVAGNGLLIAKFWLSPDIHFGLNLPDQECSCHVKEQCGFIHRDMRWGSWLSEITADIALRSCCGDIETQPSLLTVFYIYVSTRRNCWDKFCLSSFLSSCLFSSSAFFSFSSFPLPTFFGDRSHVFLLYYTG